MVKELGFVLVLVSDCNRNRDQFGKRIFSSTSCLSNYFIFILLCWKKRRHFKDCH